MAVFFYISGHGYGHASREIEVIKAFRAAAPGVHVVIRTSAPRWLFDRTLGPPFTLLEGATDSGVVQLDSLHLDEVQTIRDAAAFCRSLPALADEEAAVLRAHHARLVISDAPPLGCAAASRAGIPSIVLSNFTWDWIYEAYAEPLASEPDLLPCIQAAYRLAHAAWRLPLHGGFVTFADVVDLPFVARHATHDRGMVRRRLGLPLEVPIVLSSFGGYGLRDFDPGRLDCLDAYGVLITTRDAVDAPPPRGLFVIPEGRIYEAGLRYEDVVAAVDVVATKPGYGIISECIANRTALLYTSRGKFVEYDVMVQEIPKYLRCRFLGIQELLAGRWRAALDELLSAPPPPQRPRTDGAAVVARMMTDVLSP